MKNSVKAAVVLVVVLSFLAPYAFAKRSAPEEVETLTRDGIVYSAPHDMMGCVVAVSEKTGQIIWVKQIYVVRYDVGLEKDVQDCYIDHLELSGDVLIVKTELGHQYELDLDSLEVTKGPAVIEHDK